MSQPTFTLACSDDTAVPFLTYSQKCNLPYRQALRKILSRQTSQQQLATITAILMTVPQLDDALAEITTIAYGHVIENELWQSAFQSPAAFNTHIHFEERVEPLLRRHESNTRKKNNLRRDIEARWEAGLDSIIPSSILPPNLGQHLLFDLKRLAGICPDPQIAREHIKLAIEQRLDKDVGTRGTKRKCLTRADLKADAISYQQRLMSPSAHARGIQLRHENG
ncbi:hypothetical protein EDC01DRAFT_627758 [Geopyxis carbonaria]|nr:hypothetical protein EDC01DRAFT_627758 [Geopyxis carbonaria]